MKRLMCIECGHRTFARKDVVLKICRYCQTEMKELEEVICYERKRWAQ